MKILYHHRVGSRDGQAVHLEELIAALRRQNVEIVVVGPKSFGEAPFGHDPKFISTLKRFVPRVLYELLEIGYNALAYRRVAAVARSFQPDLIYERYNLSFMAGTWLKRRRKIPLLLEINAPLVAERSTFGGIGWKALAYAIERWIWRSADFTLPVTNVLAGHVSAAGVPREHIKVIPNAIDQNRFPGDADGEAAKAKLGLSGKLVIGFTGFLRDWHGLDTVLDWLASEKLLSGVHILIVGDGPAKPDLEAQAQALNLADKVTFTGLVGREKISEMVAAFDIAIQPRCVAYASPLKLFEYMALGKATVAPDQPNIREVLEHGVSGILFDPDAPGALSAALHQLTNDPELRTRIGSQAKETIRTREYTWDGNAKRVVALANGLLGHS